jgi:transposase-like protein
MTKRSNKAYSLEFKISSAKLAADSDQPISQTAKELGINETTLYGWVSKYCSKEQTKTEKKDQLTEELKQLRRENARLKQERDILKKAAAYFASEAQ